MNIFTTNNISKHVLYFLGYGFIFFSIHLFIISLASFFHFVLNHRFNVIEEWVFRNSWNMVMISKLISVLLMYKFLSVKRYTRNDLFHALRSKLLLPPRDIIISILFLTTFLIWYGKPYMVSDKEIFALSTLESIYGVISFYFFDFIILWYLRFLIPLDSKRDRIISCLLFPLLFYLTNTLAISYEKYFNFFLVLNFCALWTIFELTKNWFFSVFYLLVFVTPLTTFFGLDPIWGRDNAFFNFTTELQLVPCVALWLVCLGHLLIGRGLIKIPYFQKTA